MFPWVLLSRPVLNDLGNGAQTSSPERPCGSIIGFAVSKLFLDVDVQPKFSFAQFHLITAVIPLLCTPNNPPLSFLHVHSFLTFVNVFLVPLSQCQATECLPWFVKKLSALPPSMFVTPLWFLPSLIKTLLICEGLEQHAVFHTRWCCEIIGASFHCSLTDAVVYTA